MLIISLRTDNPTAEIGLFDDTTQLTYDSWPAHRQLAETLHTKIKELLEAQGKDYSDIEGIVCYQGPGSFTGLRIGLSVANALAYANQVPIAGATGEQWATTAIKALLAGHNEKQAVPNYGSEPHITLPKK